MSVVAKVDILIRLSNHVFDKLCFEIGRCLGNIKQAANLVSSGTGRGATELQPVEKGKIQEKEESAFFQNKKKTTKKHPVAGYSFISCQSVSVRDVDNDSEVWSRAKRRPS